MDKQTETIMQKWASKYLVILYCIFSLLYVFIALNCPINIPSNRIYDGSYFTTCAQNIVAGDWLGPYSHMRLIKGPGYSLFLALTHISGLPLALTEALVHIGACATAVWVLRKAGLNGLWAVVCYCILLFQPVNFTSYVIRDYLYTSLSIFAIAGIIYIVVDNRAVYWKICLLGFACGLFLITREDPHWLIFIIILIVVYHFILLCCRKDCISRYCLCIFCYILFAVIPSLIVSEINRQTYGIFTVTDVAESSFKKALKQLYSVKNKLSIYRVPINRKTIDCISKVSPSFRSIVQGLYPPQSTFGEKKSRYKKIELSADMFMWNFRRSVHLNGHYENAQAANQFYLQVASEIKQACDERKLECHQNIIPFMPNLSIASLKQSPNEFRYFIELFFYINKTKLVTKKKIFDHSVSFGTKKLDNDQEFLRDFLNIAKHYGGYSMKVEGDYYNENKSWLSVHCDEDIFIPRKRDSIFMTKLIKSPSTLTSRFVFNVDNPASCTVVFDDTSIQHIPLMSLKNFIYKHPLIILLQLNKQQYIKGPNWTLDFIELCYPVFGLINCVLFFFGSFAFCFNVVYALKKRIFLISFLIASGLWLAFYARFGLLFLVSISSFPAAHPHYMLPMWSFMTMAAMLSLHSTWQIYLGRRNNP